MLSYALIAAFITLNLVSFFTMANDKRKSVRGGDADRTPEGILFFLAAAGGSIGIYLGMLTFRHKTKRWYFQLGIPLLILQNFATFYLVTQILVDSHVI